MTPPTTVLEGSLLEQRALWRRQGATVPSLHGGKRSWLRLVSELVDQVDAGAATAMDARPDLSPGVFSGSAGKKAAAPTTDPLTWGEYSRFLKAAGLAQIMNAEMKLTSLGADFKRTGSAEDLGVALASRFRLLAESLQFIAKAPTTIEDLDAHFRASYRTDWKSLGGTRTRTDWLDALGAIEAIEARRWKITATGERLLARCGIVTPDALVPASAEAMPLSDAPSVIADLLGGFADGTRFHASRSTYNIWVPSPPTRPNKVENLRTIVNAAIDPVEREELLQFIATTFSLRRSSVDSMLPFLRASGLISEVGFGVFQATPAAQAWLLSGDDINFIRILHANMRFVGEMLRTAHPGITRTELYVEAQKFGLNVDKSRWIAAFLQDTGLIEPPRYGSLRTTPLGLALITELPLATPPAAGDSDEPVRAEDTALELPSIETHAEPLNKLSRSPLALDQASGKAFEHAIRDSFLAMGFDAKSISGSGDTDVVVRWLDDAGIQAVAIVEAKSRASGNVSHTDVSDVAIETHKTLHKAGHVAVVAPGFAGDTIKNMADKRGWALLEASRLGRIVDEAIALGLGPSITGVLFKGATGLDEVDDAIRRRRRELAVLSLVVAQLAEEASETGDAITPRDISRDGRRTELQPTIDEVLKALSALRSTAPGTIRVLDENEDPRFSSFLLGHVRSAASALRAIAQAIEAPLLSKAEG